MKSNGVGDALNSWFVPRSYQKPQNVPFTTLQNTDYVIEHYTGNYRLRGTRKSNTSYCQGGITCGTIDEPRKSSKAIDERVIINFCDKNGVIARFRDKNVVIARFCDKNGGFIDSHSDQSIAIFFYR